MLTYHHQIRSSFTGALQVAVGRLQLLRTNEYHMVSQLQALQQVTGDKNNSKIYLALFPAFLPLLLSHCSTQTQRQKVTLRSVALIMLQVLDRPYEQLQFV